MADKATNPAKPIVLYDSKRKPFGVMCGRCKSSLSLVSTFGGGPNALSTAKQLQAECCQPKLCDRCGKPKDSWCQPCHAAIEREKLHADFAKAVKVSLADYDGKMITDGDELFRDAGDWDPDNDEPLTLDDGTRFMWGTYPEKAAIDLEQACSDDWLSEHHEDAFDWVDIPKLKEAQKLVDEALAGVTTY